MLTGKNNMWCVTIVVLVWCLAALSTAHAEQVELPKATKPHPPDGSISVDPDVVIGWSPGAGATAHDVYFGTEFEDVNDGIGCTFKGRWPLDSNMYNPAGLELDQTYYWRIDVVNDLHPDSPWKGNVWSFTVAPFLPTEPEVWVDDDYDDSGANDDHIWGVDAFNRIQDGLCAVTAGGKVNVAAGTYYENIMWPNKQSIKLISMEGPFFTIIDGNNIGTVITLNVTINTTTEINGFTIRNGLATTNYAGGTAGGGILCLDSCSPTIQNNIITGNEATYGAGFCGLGLEGLCSPIIRSNTITDNHAGAGAGIEFTGTCAPLIEFNNIMRNSASISSGGIECWGNVNATIQFNQIANNSALGSYPFGNGGGIMLAEGAYLVLYGNLITGNLANVRGGGICSHYNATARVEKCILSYNTAYEFAGAFKNALDSVVCFTDCTISNNYPDGIYCYGSSSAEITYSTISDNEGDGIFCRDLSTVSMHWSNITDNSGYGVQNIDPNVIANAEYNWWGDASGPGGIAKGSGDKVSGNVDYDPWSFCDALQTYRPCDINDGSYVDICDFKVFVDN